MRGKYRWIVLSLAVIGVLLAVSCGPSGGGASAPRPITVEATEFAYTPATITVKPGERIEIVLKNSGSVEHTFVIKDLGFTVKAAPGKTARGTFTAPTTPGTYEIHCDVAGHTEAGMVGTLKVE